MRPFSVLILAFLSINILTYSETSNSKEKITNENSEDSDYKIFNKDSKYNPVFHGKQHSVELGYGSSWQLNRPDNISGNNVHFNSINNLFTRYSIPNHLFFHGRTSIEFGSIIGYLKNSNSNINQVYASLTHEFVFDLKYFYTTIGGGFVYRNIYGGVNSDQNRYDTIGSRFLFQVRIGLGVNITNSINLEVFFKHFSNGHTQLPNMGYNFFGFSVGLLI